MSQLNYGLCNYYYYAIADNSNLLVDLQTPLFSAKDEKTNENFKTVAEKVRKVSETEALPSEPEIRMDASQFLRNLRDLINTAEDESYADFFKRLLSEHNTLSTYFALPFFVDFAQLSCFKFLMRLSYKMIVMKQ